MDSARPLGRRLTEQARQQAQPDRWRLRHQQAARRCLTDIHHCILQSGRVSKRKRIVVDSDEGESEGGEEEPQSPGGTTVQRSSSGRTLQRVRRIMMMPRYQWTRFLRLRSRSTVSRYAAGRRHCAAGVVWCQVVRRTVQTVKQPKTKKCQYKKYLNEFF